MDVPQPIRRLIEEKLQSLGLELYEITFFRAGSRRILRIFIDGEEPVTIDDCERASRELSVILDVENFSSAPYTLEVSSPGADRPLVSERDFRRCRGRRVRIWLFERIREKTDVVGTVKECSNGVVTLKIDNEETAIPLASIKLAKAELAF